MEQTHLTRKFFRKIIFRLVLILTAAFLMLQVYGCTVVGPDYRKPELSAPESWSSRTEDASLDSSASAMSLVKWWENFNDPVLTGLVRRAVKKNTDLKAALARLQESRARRGISDAGRFPTLDAQGSINTRKSGEQDRQEVYSSNFDAGWELDLFGRVQRSREAAFADLEATEAGYYETLVTLSAEVALNYLEYRTYEQRLRIAEENLASQKEALDLATYRFQAGLTTALDTEQARYNLESTRAQIPALRSNLTAVKNRLSVLLGEAPGNLTLTGTTVIPDPPDRIALSIPAETLERRPDIQRAERELAAQTARIGVATADLYPRLSLLGSIGTDALTPGDLFGTGTFTDSLGPSATWNVFNSGATRNNIKAEESIRDQSLINYESAILGALEEVENALVAYTEEQKRLKSLETAADAAQSAAELSLSEYTSGLTDFQSVLDAQRSLLSIQDQLAGSKGAVSSNVVRLYKALGGGWDAGGLKG